MPLKTIFLFNDEGESRRRLSKLQRRKEKMHQDQ
jgi:hypothetical protein